MTAFQNELLPILPFLNLKCWMTSTHLFTLEMLSFQYGSSSIPLSTLLTISKWPLVHHGH